ncbi:hypothetical protein CAPTEDRAFT_222780 [Capitella teleta]|uniref:Uncharacterized protein n=1 Tax=Capitella teleta TaxID=283909 RepID=R7VHH9_CAPTE|nr:hypothetical protein CAPTEDRAFT_222780 [Capitella teleta]|eukprot:ELU18032.1 hypothetical protein CAPTEDRAFT_222780 [Capitella teleta]
MEVCYRSNRHPTGDPACSVIVGAPKDNITDPSALPQVRDVVRPGQVYSCPLSSFSDDCVALAIDREAPNSNEDKTDMWFGVSVASQRTPDGMAVACGHRYKEVGSTFRWGMGMCISLSNALDGDQFWNPCGGLSTAGGHTEYGFCQSGSSVAVNADGDIAFGIPGPYVWRGAVLKNRIVQSLTEFQENYWSPVESLDEHEIGPEPATDYYSYLGMSAKIGRVNNKTMYIGGAPRSKDLGQVLMFSQDTANRRLKISDDNYLTGEQFGSNFGHDFAVVDLNNDKNEDIVVGAPFYYEKGIGGAIYVFISGPKGVTSDTVPIKIYSRSMNTSECTLLDCENARFGFSIANIGDVDKDGFQDIAVGAPYEGNGAVYIFRGAASGIVKEYSQRIYADDLQTAREMRTFGYSLSGGIDMDNNFYPDLAVGAYESAKLVILRSRPVININAVVLSIPEKLKHDMKRCATTGLEWGCFEIRTCFKYSAEPKDRFTDRLTIEYKLEAERFTGLKRSRVFFEGKSQTEGYVLEKQIKLNAQSDPLFKCRQHTVYLNRNNRDFLNPIAFRLSYKLLDMVPPTMVPGMALPDINEYPVLNEKASSQVFLAQFEKNCGDDNICRSNLHVKGFFHMDVDQNEDYVLRVGEGNELELFIQLSNNAEDAHEATLALEMPPHVFYKGINTNDKDLSCIPTGQRVSCQVGNPMKQHHQTEFSVRLELEGVHSSMDILKFMLWLNTTSAEIDPVDDMDEVNVRIIVETDLLVRGFGLPGEVEYSGEVVGESAIRFEDEIGLSITHIYEVKNVGLGVVSNSTVFINWPFELASDYAHGKHLLYMMDFPEIQPPARCIVPNDLVNPLGVIVSYNQDEMSHAFDSMSLVYLQRVEPPAAVYDPSNPDNSNITFIEANARSKRDSQSFSTESFQDANGREMKVVTLDCDNGGAKCIRFPCHIGRLSRTDRNSVSIKIHARLWNSTFLEDFRDVDQVRIFSKAQIYIDPKLNVKQLNSANDVASAMTLARPALVVTAQKEVPLWVIILSVCAGILLLIILIIILWRCGFFKRSSHEEMTKHQANLEKRDKKEPLNYYYD